jgi:hypothetical protein
MLLEERSTPLEGRETNQLLMEEEQDTTANTHLLTQTSYKLRKEGIQNIGGF